MEETYILVETTVGTKQFAAHLAASMVGARLAACVQIQQVESVYRWQGEVRSEPEWRLAIKTTERRYAELEQYILANHSYELPEIVCLPIVGGSRAYLDWVGACVDEVR